MVIKEEIHYASIQRDVTTYCKWLTWVKVSNQETDSKIILRTKNFLNFGTK